MVQQVILIVVTSDGQRKRLRVVKRWVETEEGDLVEQWYTSGPSGRQIATASLREMLVLIYQHYLG